MVTTFDSFDQSAVGDFVESPHAARNAITSSDIDGVFVLAVKDEWRYSLRTAEIDLDAWNAFLELHPLASIIVFHLEPGDAPWGPAWPETLPWPPRVWLVQAHRPPLGSELDLLFDYMQEGDMLIVETIAVVFGDTVPASDRAIIERFVAARLAGRRVTYTFATSPGRHWLGIMLGAMGG